MAFCSRFKASTQLALGQQKRNLGHRSCVRTRVAQPSTSSATPSSAFFEHRETLEKGNHFTRHQAETMLVVFPTMKDVASKGDIVDLKRDIVDLKRDIVDLKRATTDGFDDVKRAQASHLQQMQFFMVLLAIAVVVVVGLLAGALILRPLTPSSALGMVVSTCINKL